MKARGGDVQSAFGCRGAVRRCTWLLAVVACCATGEAPLGTPTSGAPPRVQLRRFEPEANVCRAGRPEPVVAVVENHAETDVAVTATLAAPAGVKVAPLAGGPASVLPGGQKEFRWTVEAAGACGGELVLEVAADGKTEATAAIRVCFLAAFKAANGGEAPDGATTNSGKEPESGKARGYIPPPEPVQTEMLVGAHHCPLWEKDKPEMWSNIVKHPERTPALGFYAQENPEVADWETKWAVEHGVSFFIYCWYRTAQGGPVKTRYSSAIHDALHKSRFMDKMKYTIMWENQSRGTSGVSDEKDLFENLLPFWLENYFKHPSYLKVDNKPVLFIYRPEFLIQDLGGEEEVARAFVRMRQVCREAGFAGLTILGEYRGQDAKHLQLMKRLGLDYTFAYCWPIPNSPPPEEAIARQMEYIRKTQELAVLPQVVTVSQAWSGWRDEGSIWKIPPEGFAALLRQAKAFAETLPEGELGRRMLLLDNWNEWGEGHYLAPYREYGFGYLDAVREVFAPGAGPHVDLLPEDVGLGPYDAAIRGLLREREAARAAARRRVTKPGADEPGLVAWWAFDEADGEAGAFDYSGRRRGGRCLGAGRAAGLDGRALACTGGCVRVESDPAFNVTTGLTVTCWVRTDVAGQTQAWIVNRVQGGGEDTGFRLGVMGGRPCFNVPLTDWSHTAHAAAALPTGRWAHLAGTFDGTTVRVYLDGELCGSLERPGPVRANAFPIILGSYAPDHPAHFKGLLDEVRLYSRALTAAEISGVREGGRAR